MPGKTARNVFREHPGLTAFAALLAGSLAVRLWPVLAIRQSWEDAYFYLELARSLASGRYQLLGEFHLKYLPGFPAAILASHTLALGLADWFRSAQFASATASAITPGLCWVLAHDVCGDRRAAWAAGLMAMLNAHLVTFSGLPFTEALFSGQVMLVLVLAGRTPLLAGLVMGWAILTRHEGWFLAAPFLLVMLGSDRRRRQAAGLALALAMGAAWWVLSYYKTGAWLHEVYTLEAAVRTPTMGRAGLRLLLLFFPAAGHLTTLFAVAGIVAMVRSREGRPALSFLVPYMALHMWWMFAVERYLAPMVPIVCVAAGCGLHELAGLLAAARERKGKKPLAGRKALLAGMTVPALGLLAGAVHFLGFAPAMIEEEAVRTSGYVKAVKYVEQMPGDFSVMAYDLFLVKYYDRRHPAIPSATLAPDDWGWSVPGLYLNRGLRYIIWSDVYPADRAKLELLDFNGLIIPGRVMLDGREREIEIGLTRVARFYWMYQYPEPGWLKPWRREASVEKRADVFMLAPVLH